MQSVAEIFIHQRLSKHTLNDEMLAKMTAYPVQE